MGMFGSARGYTPTLNALAQARFMPVNGGPGSVRDPVPNALAQQARTWHQNPADRARGMLGGALRGIGQLPGEARSTAENMVAFSPVGAADDFNSGAMDTRRGLMAGSKAETLGGILAMALAGAPIPGPVKKEARAGIRAFHVSPHDFDRFRIDPTTARTGEGAQVYGFGGYFAEGDATRDAYYKQFANSMGNPINARGIASELVQNLGHERALQELQGRVDNLNYRRATAPHTVPEKQLNGRAPMEDTLDILKRGERVLPVRYDVNLNVKPEELLDWDVPLLQQPAPVLEAIRSLGIDPVKHTVVSDGGRAYGSIADLNGGHANASALLNERGVPGIRYLDQGSRYEGSGTRNYVIFDDSKIDILRKYGLAGGMMAGTTAAAMSQRQPDGM